MLRKLTALLLIVLLCASCSAPSADEETAPPFSSALTRTIDTHYRVTLHPVGNFTDLYCLAPTPDGYLCYTGSWYEPENILTLDKDFLITHIESFPPEITDNYAFPCRLLPASSGVPFAFYKVEEENYRDYDTFYEVRQGDELLFRLPEGPNNHAIYGFHLLETPDGIYMASYHWIVLEDKPIEFPTVDPMREITCQGLFSFAGQAYALFRIEDKDTHKNTEFALAALADGKCGALTKTAIVAQWFTCGENYVYYLSDHTICRTDGYHITSCCDLLAAGINGDILAAFAEGDKVILLLSDAVAVLEEDADMERTETITVGAMWFDYNFSDAVAAFNREDHGFQVKIRTFENMTQINLAMASHELDLLTGILTEDIQSRARLGLLEPLDNFLDLSRFYPNLVALGSVKGECYFLPYTFSLHGMVLPEKCVPERGYFENIRELSETLDAMNDPYRKLNTPDDLLFALKVDGFEEFIDRESASCSFDSQEFIDLLAFCADSVPTRDEVDANQSGPQSHFNSNHTLSALTYVDMLSDFYDRSAPGEHPYRRASIFPVVGRGKYKGLSVQMEQMLAVPAGFPHPYEVEEFLNFLYSDETMKNVLSKVDQSPFIPVRRALKEQTALLCEDHDLPPDAAERTDSLIAAADHFYNSNISTVSEIVTEEAGRYFRGEITAETAAKYIQNRVTLMLEEQS